ncbi:UNVERIFIED_CONTAM: hypothetical protein GTU68_049900 [Idotea baltica]|nr:hypothetical protein [Idotea baltica]
MVVILLFVPMMNKTKW